MRNVLILVTAPALSVLLFINIHYQTFAQQEKSDAIKLRSTEVLVDAVVVDRKNRLVTDLSPRDFQVYEDGVLQEVTSFRVVRGANSESLREGTATANVQPTRDDAKPAVPREMPPNLTIVLLDYSTTQFEHQKLIQSASIKYVEQKLQPRDLMAVFVLGSGLRLLTDFTNDKAKLIEALKKTDLTGSALAYDRSNSNVVIRAGQAPGVQFQENTYGATPSGQSAAAQAAEFANRFAGLGAAIIAQHLGSLEVAMRSGMDRRQSLGVISAIRAIAAGVKGIEGRKTLLLFSEGFVVGPSTEEDLYAVAGVANRAQLAIYSIESQGLLARDLRGDLVPRDDLTSAISNTSTNKMPRGGETGFDRARQAGQDLPESALRYIANATGGFLIRNTNDLSVGLDRVDQEMRSYYLLSYRSQNEKMDGRFRQIRVSVNKPDLSVRARNGYYAMPAGLELLTPPEFQLIDQSRKGDSATKIPVFMRVGGFQEGKEQYRVPVILEIPSKSLRFEVNQGKRSARLVILGLVRDRAGALVKRFGGPVQVEVTESEFGVLKAGSVSFVNHIRVPAGADYSFEVYVKDSASGMVASSQKTLHLQQTDPVLAISEVLLAAEVDKPSALDDQFLTVNGVKILPSARCQFHNGDNLIFYFQIYNSRFDRENKRSDISIELSLIRDGKTMNVRLPNYRLLDHAGVPDAPITFSRFLHLAGLTPGDYTLSIDVHDAMGDQRTKGQAVFTLVN